MADLLAGRKVVTTAGTAVQLAASASVKSVAVQAETDNTGVITIGSSTVVGALATRKGLALSAGDGYAFAPEEIDDLGDVWLDTTVNGDGVTYVAVTQ